MALWSPKGGSGTSVVAASLAVILARQGEARLADLAGDQPAILGVPPEPRQGLAGWMAAGAAAPTEALDDLGLSVGPGLTLLPFGPGPSCEKLPGEAGAALATALRDGVDTVADAGLASECAAHRALVEVADVSLVVVRGCYLALRRAVRCSLVARAAGVVLVEEPGRALGEREVSEILERPVLARYPVRASVARAVDAGVLACRLPNVLVAPAETVVGHLFAQRAGRAA